MTEPGSEHTPTGTLAPDALLRALETERTARRRAEAAERDLTERVQRAELRLRLKDAVTRILGEARSLPETAQRLLAELGAGFDWDVTALWLADPATNDLRLHTSWCNDDPRLRRFVETSRSWRPRPGEGLLGRVWSEARPHWVVDTTNDEGFVRADAARDAGLHTAIGIPLRVHGEVLGTIECCTHERRARDEYVLDAMANVGVQIAQFIERMGALAALLESEERFRTMANAAPVMVWMAGPDTLCDFFNEAWLAFTGRTLEQELGNGWAEGVHPDDFERCLGVYLTSFERRAPFEMEYRLRDHAGEYRWLLDRGAPRYTSSGEFQGYIGGCIDIDDRKRSERAVTELNALTERRLAELQAVLDVVPVGIMIAEDASCKNIRGNPAFADMLGIPADVNASKSALEADMLPFRVLQDGREVEADRLILQVAAATARSIAGEEYEIVRGDGSKIDVLEYAAPLLSDGEVVGAVGAIVDVTERKRAQEQIALREEMYRSLAEALPALVMIISANGHVDYCNRRLLDYAGRTVDELQGTGWVELIHPEDVERGAAFWRQQAGSGQSIRAEYRVRRADGTYRWQLGHIVPLRRPNGSVFAWLGATIDIDDRKRTEEQQQFVVEATTRLSSSLDFETTLRTLARLAVPRFADLCTIDIFEDEHTARRLVVEASDPERAALVERIHVRDWPVAPGASQRVADVLPAGESVLVEAVDDEWLAAVVPEPEQLELVRRGEFRSLILVPLRARGATLGVLGLVTTAESERHYGQEELVLARDLAHRAGIAADNARLFERVRRTADHLRIANQAKDEFLGLVSHELRTPITTIYGNALVLQKHGERFDADVRNAALADMAQESARLQQIIDNMFVLARLEAGQDAQTEPLLMRQALMKIVDEHMRRYPHRKVELRVAPDLPPAMAEPVYVGQVVRNLLTNAEKYSPAVASIDVVVGREGDELAVRVLDRGDGIDPDEADVIFTAFYRSPSTATHATGAGMGLAVCKRLVEAQHGRIWARPRDGGGSEFGFTLPIEQEALP